MQSPLQQLLSALQPPIDPMQQTPPTQASRPRPSDVGQHWPALVHGLPSCAQQLPARQVPPQQLPDALQAALFGRQQRSSTQVSVPTAVRPQSPAAEHMPPTTLPHCEKVHATPAQQSPAVEHDAPRRSQQIPSTQSPVQQSLSALQVLPSVRQHAPPTHEEPVQQSLAPPQEPPAAVQQVPPIQRPPSQQSAEDVHAPPAGRQQMPAVHSPEQHSDAVVQDRPERRQQVRRRHE